MQLFDCIAVLVVLTALCSYLNHRYVRLHPSIGVMLIALVLSLALVGLNQFHLGFQPIVIQFLSHIPFGPALLQWMLGFLLFAGALTVDINQLAHHRGVAALLATAGTVLSMFIVAGLAFLFFHMIGSPLSWHGCLLFGALISPTDPVAVVAIMRQSTAPKSLETIVSAESLLNDGVGVVLFLTLLQAGPGDAHITALGITRLFFQEAIGGAALGFVAGIIIYQLLKRAHSFEVEVLLTLALVMGVYSLAGGLHFSAPIAVVVAGLLIGNRGRTLHTPEQVSADLDRFWHLVDELLNAILFVLIGLEVLTMPFIRRHAAAALVSIPIVLIARLVSVVGIVFVLPARRRFTRPMLAVLTWGGLRGGLAVAMALSLPSGPQHDLLVPITYAVVCFSILIQGTTIRPLVRRTLRQSPLEHLAVS